MSNLKDNHNFTKEDRKYMEIAMKLAGRGRGDANPNPMVGAIIVKDGKIISSGYHRQAGLHHAEIEAINNSIQSLESSTMYVTLEPCTFQGKTPPCVNEIVKHKLKEIIIGCIDPNPKVNGRGIEFLKKAGIKVKSGLLKNKIEQQNEVFFKQIKTGIPFICCKIASSIDGKLAAKSSDSRWITSEKSRMQVQDLRKEYGCILTGINTVLNDNPYLFPRKNIEYSYKNYGSQKFYRVILDSNLRINLDSNIVKTSNLVKTIVFIEDKNKSKFTGKIKKLEENNIDVLPVNKDIVEFTGLDILKIIKILYKKYEITSILLECGPALITSFLKRNLIDKFIFYFAPKIIGGDSDYNMFTELGINKIKDSINLRFENIKRKGSDIVITAYPLK
ncbi:MAG: bifunctional diaminohydroxyphosphoribosylaminopyrimidine deaminase/5-amino-6-(5-phosphoribosylamino)uracil reductase RibD [Chloroflexi bacterium]|nr:bifunctional diaminohydroxyphosphoribosylaminopyrimidine deaminase/5-amino-6-(5-phosphoribosylamino)uracil reductase RibD [Chloroflexota bacterium]MBE3114672.1 bifunctional diaminohydroxyphosphoribosylaminopyrimidine deaminase/5-amino-6-(5-phosphoribosylamino)uracil reductase RibD [Actinomycetota bacterium]